MKRTIWVALILGMILLIPAYLGAETIDPDPVNFGFATIRWDNRDYGNFGTYKWIGGSRLRSGAYIMIECGIETGGDLNNIEDVIKVVAVNKSQNGKRRYILHYAPIDFLGREIQYWVLLVQPDEAMFKGNWKIILQYNATDGEHTQVRPTAPPPNVFPAAIGNVEVNRFDANYLRVAWSGIGVPEVGSGINYQILVDEGGEIIEAYSIDYEFFDYNPESNIAVFLIPKKYAGKKYFLRLASVLSTNRSLYYMILPKLVN